MESKEILKENAYGGPFHRNTVVWNVFGTIVYKTNVTITNMET